METGEIGDVEGVASVDVVGSRRLAVSVVVEGAEVVVEVVVDEACLEVLINLINCLIAGSALAVDVVGFSVVVLTEADLNSAASVAIALARFAELDVVVGAGVVVDVSAAIAVSAVSANP